MRPKGKKIKTVQQIDEKILEFETAYGSFTSPKNKWTALKILKYIVNNIKPTVLIRDADCKKLARYSSELLFIFLIETQIHGTIKLWAARRRFVKAETVFQTTISLLLPEQSIKTITVILELFTEHSWWANEYFVYQTLTVLLYYSHGRILVYRLLLNEIKNVLLNMKDMARQQLKILYELLASEYWVISESELFPFMMKLLDLFGQTFTTAEECNCIRRGFEVCLRRVFERIENNHRLKAVIKMLYWVFSINMSDPNLLEVTTLLEYAAYLYKMDFFDSLKDDKFLTILTKLIESESHIYSLIGCKLLQQLLDRQCNRPYLAQPQIFYKYSLINLRVAQYNQRDKTFITHYRQSIHNSIFSSLKNHCSNLYNIKETYSLICIIILEVPCGLTAAAMACLLMEVQEFALKHENVGETSKIWLHAMIVSSISLICWVHKAPVLYQYVNTIVSRRANEAPALNPPLLKDYKDKMPKMKSWWYKPTLYFEDWELRYGLWKHFQGTTDGLRKSRDTTSEAGVLTMFSNETRTSLFRQLKSQTVIVSKDKR